MAEIKITDLAEVTAPLLTDIVVMVQGGTTKKFTLLQLQTLLVGGASIASPGGSNTIRVGTSNPATCVRGDLFVNTTNGKLYTATATNTWTVVGTQF